MGEFREFILDDRTGGDQLASLAWGITPEMAAAVTKLMSNKDLVLGAVKLRKTTQCRKHDG